MEIAKVMKGLAFVKKFFPHARLASAEHPSQAAVAALTRLGELEQPLPSDIVPTFDAVGAGIWRGEEIN
jgi:hypothetical protein